ncbi:MAG: phosphohydrolase [Lachnospiraceae bacterium]|jgi:uncharacterized protein|nr:phosphohydrolase [Lachnospiraceae bacterium]
MRKLRKQRRKSERNFISQIEIDRAGKGILESDNFKEASNHIQHGTMTVDRHCINVAKCSLAFADKLHIKCKRNEMIRGALLHDYFQYDWHEPSMDIRRRLHGFYHPGIALHNAQLEYTLTSREKDIIKKHMWPMTIVLPRYREAWIVSLADKWCSFLETIRIHK